MQGHVRIPAFNRAKTADDRHLVHAERLFVGLAGSHTGRAAGEACHRIKIRLGLGRASTAGALPLHLDPLNTLREEEFAAEKELVVVRILVRACG